MSSLSVAQAAERGARILNGWIGFSPALARALTSRTAALFIQHIHDRMQFAGASGWVSTDAEGIEEWTTLSEKEQRSARALLRDRGLLEEKQDRLAHRSYFRVNLDVYGAFLLEASERRNAVPEPPSGQFGNLPQGSSSKAVDSTAVDSPALEAKIEPTKTTPRPADAALTVEELVDLYNDLAPDNVPAVESLSQKRREKARRALRQWPTRAWWIEVFNEYKRSRFLSGKVQPTNGHASFRPDFDWLLATGKDGTENAVKVHDGAYSE